MQANCTWRALSTTCGKEPHLGERAAQQGASADGFAAAELGRYA